MEGENIKANDIDSLIDGDQDRDILGRIGSDAIAEKQAKLEAAVPGSEEAIILAEEIRSMMDKEMGAE